MADTEDSNIVDQFRQRIDDIQQSISKSIDALPLLQIQSKLLETVVEKIGMVFTDYINSNAETNRQSLEKVKQVELETLKILDQLDKRDKWYKAIMIVLCVGALSILGYFDKAQQLSPVIGVIIGLLLKSSSITEFLSTEGKKTASKTDAST
ncbi:MAG: hypothetical protein K1X91_15930 [Bacteriodetes bacterium]|nr:hypothetical protein [Bacteroidota bacterium]